MTDQAHLTLEGLSDAHVESLGGREAINELTCFELDVTVEDAHVDLDALIDRDAAVSLRDGAGELTHFHLVVLDASARGRLRDRERYHLTLGSPLARLRYRVNHEVFQDKTTQEIVKELIERVGFPPRLIRWRLAGQYAKRVYTVQYGESDWDFIARLLADEGICFWFDRDGEDSTIVFGDSPASHDGIEGDNPVVVFQETSGLDTASFGFHGLSRTWSLTSSKYALRDIDVQNPAVPVDGESGEGELEVFEYPSNLTIPEAAADRAKVRLQQVQRFRAALSAHSGNARIRAGRVVEISGAADEWFSGRMLLVAVEHELSQSAQGERAGASYRNRAQMVPVTEDVPFRPAVPERRPIVDGLENAVVTGPSGEEIHVDDLGRVKLRFFWDRSGVGDETSSRWIRTLQMNLTAPQMLPRVGWEVAVVYEHGNPDRPFVLGRLYNAGAPPPYSMPGKSATSTLQSATSPSDGTTQELRLGDDAGSEEAFVHATKNHSVFVGGSHLVKVAANRSDDVKKSHSLQIDSSQTASVSGNQKITVGANGAIAVQGSRSEIVAGMEKVGVTGTYACNVSGAYVEIVGGLYGLVCNQSNATIQGAFTQVVGGAMSLTAGLGANQSVAGARTEVVDGSRSFTAGLAYADGTTGLKKVQAGASSEKADVDMAIKASARSQIKAGAAMKIEGGDKVAFEAAKITFKAASLTAKGGSTLKLAGSMKSSGTIKLDASTTKKTDKVKVEG